MIPATARPMASNLTTSIAGKPAHNQIRTGDYRLRIWAGGGGCTVTAITRDETDGRWSSRDCESTRRPGSYVDYYTFEVTGSRTKRVQIAWIYAKTRTSS